MLAEIEDRAQIAEVKRLATSISKSLSGVENEAALMALCLVIADVITQSIDPEHWHLSIADVTSAVALNVGHHAEDCEHCKAAEKKH